MPVRVTVVVVTYNSEAQLPEFFATLGTAAEEAPRVIVVDNDSTTDPTGLVGRLDPAARVVRTGGNLGFAAGINAGLREADRSRPVMILNPDIRLDPGALGRLADALDARPRLGAVVPRLRDEHDRPQPTLRHFPTAPRVWAEAVLGGPRADRLGLGIVRYDADLYESPTTTDWATGGAVMLGPEAMARVAEWDESLFMYEEEVEYAYRLRDNGLEVGLVPDATAMRVVGDGLTDPALYGRMRLNRVRLHRRRRGRFAAVLVWAGLLAGESVRALRGSRVHRGAVTALVWPWSTARRLPLDRSPASRART